MVLLQSPKPEFQGVLFFRRNDAGERPSSRIPRNFLVYGNLGGGSIGAGAPWVGYFELDILPIVKNKRNATIAITIKDNGLSRMPT